MALPSRSWTFSVARGRQNHASQLKVLHGAYVLPDAAAISSPHSCSVPFFHNGWDISLDEIVAGLPADSESGNLGFQHGCQFYGAAAHFLPLLFFEGPQRAMIPADWRAGLAR